MPRELDFASILEINSGYVGLFDAFGKKAGVVDDLFVFNADYHSRNQAPSEPGYEEFQTDHGNIERSIDISIKLLNRAFDRARIPRRNKMPLLNQMIATARFEAQALS